MTKHCLHFASKSVTSHNITDTQVVAFNSASLVIPKTPWLALILTSLLACLSLSLLFSQGAIAAEAQKPADIRVLIDVSGSMKQNDPRNLRRPAMDMLVQLFPAESRAGVWTFGKYVNMLVPHDDVDSRWRDSAANKSRLVNSVALHTNIGLALEKANYDSNTSKYPTAENFKTSVILLTDGVVDLSQDPATNDAERARILEEVLPQYKAAGVAIHAIALSTNADVELLERLSIETDGVFAVAEDAEALDRIFLRAFDQSAQGDRTPLEDNRFLIDSSVEEFTALVFKKVGSEATQIVSPDGQYYSAESDGASVRWFSSEAYDLITIAQPIEGEWRINAEMDPENRVTVVSDLSLAIDPIDNNLYHGNVAQLNASLVEDGKAVSGDEFLDLLTVDAQMSRGDTTFWQQRLPRNFGTPGKYSRKLDMLRNSGDYTLTVMVDGKTFKREKTIKFTVREPFRVELAANEQAAEYTLTVMADDKRLRTDAVEVFANIENPNGSSQQYSLEQQSPGVWVHHATEQSTGEYLLAITARGTNIDAEPVEQNAGEHSFYLSVPGIPEPARIVAEPVAEPLEEPQLLVESEPVIDDKAKVKADVEAEAVAQPVVEAKPDASPNLMLYAVLGLGNVVLVALLYFVYRKMFATTRPVDAYEQGQAEEQTAEDFDAQVAEADVVETVEDALEEPFLKAAGLEEAGLEESVLDEEISAGEQGVDELVKDLASAPAINNETRETVAEDETEADKLLTETAEQSDADDKLLDQPVAERASKEPISEAEPETIDLDAMLDVDEESVAEAAPDSGINPEDSASDETELEDDIEAILAEIDEGDEAAEVAQVAEVGQLDDDDITLDLDGEFDLSSDVSDDSDVDTGAIDQSTVDKSTVDKSYGGAKKSNQN